MKTPTLTETQTCYLKKIKQENLCLERKFVEKLVVNPDLTRRLVSFQANKAENGHRWFKYKEGFSASLMQYIFRHTSISANRGRIIDPFAGSGTALFEASKIGLDSLGIELLPNSAEIIEVKKIINKSTPRKLISELRAFRKNRIWETSGKAKKINHLRITEGAYPVETERLLERYLYETEKLQNKPLGRILRFAALCVLEPISYTRKDGQYLRWDWRSGRTKAKLEKPHILRFSDAITAKLDEIAGDIESKIENRVPLLFASKKRKPGEIELRIGSCLELLPQLEKSSFTGLVTSPPYCNRYDYTRTYALELALLGVDEQGIKDLRQTMLSCTVENREKEDLGTKTCVFSKAKAAWTEQVALQLILEYLEECRAEGSLNNPGISRMVRNYFLELAVVIFEAARVLEPGAPFVMVNDNVRYQGAHIPVDLILSDIACKAGFEVETIWVLPRGKGNSSQQMGLHGREEVRKGVYVWRKN